MKKFVFLYQGRPEQSSDMQAWGEWFAAHGGSFVDVGNPFGEGRIVTSSGAGDASSNGSTVTGYSIVSAESLDDAEKLLEGLPIMESVTIYEALPM